MKKLSRVLDTLFLIGWGIWIHASASELYYKAGYSEILSIQGEWIGAALIMISYLIFRFQRGVK